MEQAQIVYTVRNDVEADNLISEIRELEADKNRFEMIYKAKMEQIKSDYDRQAQAIDKHIEFNKSMLQAYFLTVPAKATKTQKTYKLLSGKLVMKLPSQSISKEDDEKLINWVKESNLDFIKVKEEVNWSELKKTLKIVGDIVVTEDGEVVEGVVVKAKGEEFSISL